MGKPTGSTNHSLPEMYQMLDIVKRILPQGKDYWDTVTARYNATSVFLASDAEDENEVDVNDFRVSRGRRSDRGGPSSGESAELYAGSDQVDESDAADDDFNQLDSLVYTYIDSTESGPALTVGREDRARGGGAAEAKGAAERDARDERRREERREEREAAEERRRIDREESRAHMREMMMMLSA
ncbi:hypothetical protein PC119_g24651 [Phytophthora cactorum]|nr:hypothetical protein PC119_g24651 [Phytophthora cactorum]